jgi:hypothetical protein
VRVSDESDERSRLHRQAQGEISRPGGAGGGQRRRASYRGEIRDDETPLPLPLAAEPTRTEITALSLPKLDPPRTPPQQGILPGLGTLAVIDDSATVPVPLLEADEGPPLETTPPPLPPSPASAAAEVWLEDAVTRPSMLPDLAGTSAGNTMGQSGTMPALAAPVLPSVIPAVQVEHGSRALLILSSATSFVVGLILGALLFRGGRPSNEPPGAEHQAMTVCAPAEVPDAAP